MHRPVAFFLLLLQLVFAALPGDGLVLCFGGAHGPLGLCAEDAEDHLLHREHGSEPLLEVVAAQGQPCESSAGDAGDHCHDCDGAHLTRGALEPWNSTAAPERALRPIGDGVAWLAPAWQAERSGARCADAHCVCAPRRAPPPTQALEVVRVTELRI